MKPFKKPYRVAAAGAAVAAGVGLVSTAAVTALIEKCGGRTPKSVLAIGPAVAGAVFAALYYPPYCRRRRACSEVYLTFDDGPDAEVTPQILDSLARHGARATFFMLGENAARFPEIVRRVAQEGHTLGIHGFHHDSVTLRWPDRIGLELDGTLEAITSAAPGAVVPFYRPPFGLRGPGLGAALRRRGLRMVLWTLDSHDYLARSAGPIEQRIAARARAGDVVLMHDAGAAGRATAAALPVVLEEASRAGWRCEALNPL